MPGPPPKHPSQRRRRNLSPDTVKLPASGRKGKPPALGNGFLKATHDWWKQIWATPQAVMWEESSTYLISLKRLAGLMDLALRGNLAVTAFSEVRHLEDRLGFTPLALKRLGWEIVPDDQLDAEKPDDEDAPSPASGRKSRRSGRRTDLKVLAGGK